MVRHIPCGMFVNESERLAVARLTKKLRDSDGTWILLSNLNHARHPNARSDEIDIVAIGGPGVFVLEVKHWKAEYIRKNPVVAEREADRIDAKAKRVAGKLRQRLDPGFVEARLLLTRGEVRFDAAKRPSPRGVAIFGLPEWSELLSVGGQRLRPDQIELAARWLEPDVKIALSGELRTFAGLVNLERISDKTDACHRIYRGQHPTRRDRVILHLYDLSATQEKQALEMARREFDTIQRWQKSPFVPSLLDSFQEAEGYPGEIYFYSMVDPAAPSLAERSKDGGWDHEARLAYAQVAIDALRQFHEPPPDSNLTPIVHRHLSPASLRVRHNNQPLFTDFNLSRLQDANTISPAKVDYGDLLPFVAEEVRQGGIAAADARSDIAALCASLLTLFDPGASLPNQVRALLEPGCAPNPADRRSLEDLSGALAQLTASAPATAPVTSPDLPPADYWDEDTVVDFQQSRYKIVSRLGRGRIGQTFKVVELDAHSDEKFGTYVAKLVRDAEDGEAAIRAYKRVRAYTTQPHLSTIHEIAPAWEPDHFVALMKWVEGQPLQDLTGVLSLYAEDLGDPTADALAQRWLHDLCGALGELQRVGLVHGDVSPKNLIVQGGNVVLTDYHTVTQAGEAARGGTLPYASPEAQARAGIQPRDDGYSLAASLFHCLTDREPFAYGAERRKDLGLNWEDIEEFDALRPFFDRATHPDTERRFPDALSARRFLEERESETSQPEADQGRPVADTPPSLTPNQVPWLSNLLSSYPGSRHGNSETRGLDSPFAEATYVETRLGDGRKLKVNLDGAAAWEGQNANALLDDLFRPSHSGTFSRGRQRPVGALHHLLRPEGRCTAWHSVQHLRDPDLRPTRYWQRAFDAQSPQRQGELLAEMARFDPALEADPILDRRLLREPLPDRTDNRLAQARRRAWFTRPAGAAGGDIGLANGRHLARFRGLPLMSPEEATALLRDLCLGIARLEDLPALAFGSDQLNKGVPLRITPRTPTESAFWIVKSWERFDLKPALARAAEGLETLHTHLHLIYRYTNGAQEVLTMGLELFHLLLELRDGVQISGVAQEGVFANLEIFTQRLAREDARALHGWHPAEEDRVFQVRIVPRDGRQILVREAV